MLRANPAVTDILHTASTAAGAVLVLLTLRDVFYELFRPGGDGTLSRLLRRGAWRGFHALAGRWRGALLLAGPAILVATIALWAAALAVGGALLIWPQLPEGYRFASPLVGGLETGFDTALYVSVVTLTTLGFGDVTPTTSALRLVAMLEASVGFALLTAGISWIQAVYPVLARRRALAERLTALEAAERRTGTRLADVDASVAATVLAELAAELAAVHVDLVQTSVSYYFDERPRRISLPALLPLAVRLADEGLARDDAPAVRHAAAALRATADAYLETLRADFLHEPERPIDALLRAYAADHRRDDAAA